MLPSSTILATARAKPTGAAAGHHGFVQFLTRTPEAEFPVREEQERWYRAHGRIPSGHVFTVLDGGPMSPDYLTRTSCRMAGRAWAREPSGGLGGGGESR